MGSCEEGIGAGVPWRSSHAALKVAHVLRVQQLGQLHDGDREPPPGEERVLRGGPSREQGHGQKVQVTDLVYATLRRKPAMSQSQSRLACQTNKCERQIEESKCCLSLTRGAFSIKGYS